MTAQPTRIKRVQRPYEDALAQEELARVRYFWYTPDS